MPLLQGASSAQQGPDVQSRTDSDRDVAVNCNKPVRGQSSEIATKSTPSRARRWVSSARRILRVAKGKRRPVAMGNGASSTGSLSCTSSPKHSDGERRTRDEENRIVSLEAELKERTELVDNLQVELRDLSEVLRLKEEEVLKLTREVHKLKSVLEVTAAQDGHPDLLANIHKHTPSTSQGVYVKKQGVSGESAHSRGQVTDTSQVQIHEKDFRSKQVIKDAIMDNDFLKNLVASQVREIVDCMYGKDFLQEALVIKEGEPGSHLYVSAEGQLEVIKEDKVLGRMGPGKAFGELAILYNCTRTASVRAVTNAKVWVLDRRVFQAIMMRTGLQRQEENISFLRSSRGVHGRRPSSDPLFLQTFAYAIGSVVHCGSKKKCPVRSVPLLQNLTNELLAKMADVLEVDFYPAGEYIVRQGETGDNFFIINNGQVKVTQKIPGTKQEEEIRVLGRGDYFGEQALLREDRRTANVIAAEPGVECLALDRESFSQLIGDLLELQNKQYDDKGRLQRVTSFISPTTAESDEEHAHIQLEDLDVLSTLGVGGFGRVELLATPGFPAHAVQYIYDKSKTFALKVLQKQHIVDTQQQEHALSERNIMMSCKHSFICRMYKTFKDDKYIYMLMEACLGGEVWSILRDRGSFDDTTTRFYTACVIEALEYLHNRNVVYRDLKPENLLLDTRGYLKLVDFGFSKVLANGRKTWTFCGTPEYVAPEIILNKGHDRAVDFWSIGVMMYELFTGTPPFSASDPMKTYKIILKGIDMVDFPRNISKTAQSLMKRMCRENPGERLGYQKGGIVDIKKHKWFQGFDWDGLRARALTAPIVPQVQGPTDTTNFDIYPKDFEIPENENSGWDKDF